MTEALERLQHGALGVLLFAGVLWPVAAELLGWRAVPPAATAAAAAVVVVLAAVLVRLSPPRRSVRVLYVALAGVLAAAGAAVLRAQANAFYTPGALLGGMMVMLSLHVGAVAMRHVAIRDEDVPRGDSGMTPMLERLVSTGLERLPPNEIRVVRAGGTVHEPGEELRGASQWQGDPAIALGDALAGAATWLLLLFWGLVAVAHRHFASASLLLTGALLTARCVVLLPEVLAGRARAMSFSREAP